MNHREFGELVASLRDDLRWSQAELAERAEVGLAAIHEIESGRRKTLLGDDTLIRLANGLLLTSAERREFLLAASGVTELELMRPDIGSRDRRFDVGAFLQQVGEQIGTMRVPVYVTDSFCDVLLVNHLTMGFYDPPENMVFEAGKSAGGFNQIHYVFHRDSNFPAITGEEEWDRIAMINVRHFRKRTLRFRSKSYYSTLIKQFMNPRKYPYFERYWRKVAFEIHDEFAIPAASERPNKDHAYVETESLLALTPYGELYQHQLLPVNAATSKRINEILKQAGQGYLQFARLPDRRKE